MTQRMVFLGFGKYARADKIYALEPITGDDRGGGRRTRVWIEGVSEPLVASRTERTILHDMGAEAGDTVAARRRTRPRGAARRGSRRGQGRPRGPRQACAQGAGRNVAAERDRASSSDPAAGALPARRARSRARSGGLDAGRGRRGRDRRRDGSLRAGRSRKPLLRRPDASQRDHVRAGGKALRLPLVRRSTGARTSCAPRTVSVPPCCLRAVEPTTGVDVMRARRGVDDVRLLASGPGRLTQALGITAAHDGLDLGKPPFALDPPARRRRGRGVPARRHHARDRPAVALLARRL